MKKTEKMELNLMESSDPFSAAPLNENTTKLDAAVGANSAAVKAHGEAITSHGETLESHGKTVSSHSKDISALKTAAAKIPGKAMMACGTYEGTGEATVSLPTPGFKATALMMRCLQGVTTPSGKVTEGQITYQSGDAECRGFTMWAGEDLKTRLWYEDGKVMAPNEPTGGYVERTGYSASPATINFTPAVGTLSWKLNGTMGRTVYNPGANVNNEEGKTYEWIAFGTEVI